MNLRYLVQPFGPIESISWWYLVLALATYISVRAIFVQGGLYLAITRSRFLQQHKVFQLPFGQGQLASEFRASLNTIIIDSLIITFLVKVVPSMNSEEYIFSSFLLSFVWFEIWFYTLHRVLHSPALYWMHKQHHVAKVTSPLTAMSFSIVERVMLILGGVGFLSVLAIYFPVARIGIALYLFVNYALNLYGHSNIELVPPKWLKWAPNRILNTPTYHALHHARYKGHYGLFTPYLDSWLKTRFADYYKVHAAAFDGQGLKSLGQRMEKA